MCLSEIEHEHRPGRTKRRIIGGVVRAPSEAVPVASLEHLGTGTPTLCISPHFEAFRKGSRHPGASGGIRGHRYCTEVDPLPPPAALLAEGRNGNGHEVLPCPCDALMRWSRGQSLLGLWPETKRHCENLRDVRSPRHKVTRAR